MRVVPPALEATADDVLAADGYLLVTTANFGYMSGALKHFFDSTFLQVGGALAPNGAAGESRATTKGGPSGCRARPLRPTGAVRSVLSIVRARLEAVRRRARGRSARWTSGSCEAAYELGGTLAALLAD